jgi:uncharacterized protein (DUF2141 family)
LALAASAMLNVAASSPDVFQVEVAINGMRSAKGNVLLCLTANPKAFPDCSKDASATRMQVTARQAANLHLSVAHSGSYAISVIHDENGNGKLDTTLLMPREGFGFSRNPKIAFGPPKFTSAAFPVQAGDTVQVVTMKYML